MALEAAFILFLPTHRLGVGTAWNNGLKPLATLSLNGTSHTFYVGLGALILNIGVAAVVTVIVGMVLPDKSRATARS